MADLLLYLRSQVGAFIIGFVVFTVLAASGIFINGELLRWQLERQSTDDWFVYHGIRFVEEDPEGRGGLGSLRMESDTTLHRTLELGFHDVLRCEHTAGAAALVTDINPETDLTELGVLEFVSQNPDTSTFVAEARPRRQGNWLYNASYPRDRTCVVTSTITGTISGVEKVVQVSSPPFSVDR